MKRVKGKAKKKMVAPHRVCAGGKPLKKSRHIGTSKQISKWGPCFNQ